MIDLRPINAILGILIAVLGVMMTAPAVADLVHGHEDWVVFAVSAAATVFSGAMLWLTGRQAEPVRLNVRQAFVLTGLSWTVLAGFGGLPFMWSEAKLSFTDAYFESMSGLTTTGASVLSGLDGMPPGILLWRSLMQWYGGIGIIVVAIAILPMLRIGGMQLFRTESSDKSEKILPRVAQISNRIMIVYVALTAMCAAAYVLAGMSLFDALNHAMTTLSTGGFSTRDASIGHFRSTAIDYISVAFMIVGSLPMVLFVTAFAGDPARMWRSPEVRLFLLLIAAFTAAMVLQQRLAGIAIGEQAFRHALFNVTTLISTTGFATTDYTNWGAASDAILFAVMFLGGCTGSTAGGLKTFRLAIVGSTLAQHIRRVVYPNGVFPIRFGTTVVGDEVVASVMSFLFLYIATFVAVSIVLNGMGYDLHTAVSAAITCLANVGPGLGTIVGPAGNFAPLNDAAIWLLSFAMLVGRLELFTIFVLLLPRFWRT